MTAPNVGTGLEVISDEPPSAPVPPDFEYVGYPNESVTASTIAYLRRKGGAPNDTPLVVSAAGNGSTRTQVNAGGAWVRRYQKQLANDDCWAMQTGPSFGRVAADFGTPLGAAAAGSPALVVRFIESLRFVGAINANSRLAHGFAICLQNLLTGGGPGGTGVFAGVGLMWSGTGGGRFDLFHKVAGVAPVLVDVGLEDLAAAGFVVIEHRLFYPGVAEAGRYELLVNGVRRGTIDGADIPVPTLVTDAPKPLYIYTDNGNGGTNPGTETLWTRVIVGDADILQR